MSLRFAGSRFAVGAMKDPVSLSDFYLIPILLINKRDDKIEV